MVYPNVSHSGMFYLLKGIKRLPEPSIRWFVVIPLLLNLMLYIAIFNYASGEFSGWMARMTSYLPSWLSFLEWLMWPLFFVMLLVIVYFTFTIFANLIASPFYGLMAEKIQSQAGQLEASDTSLLYVVMAVVPKSLWREVQKNIWLLPRLLALLVISLIPVINLVAPFLWILFGAWNCAVQYSDYAADNDSVSFRQMLHKLRTYRFKAMIFGISVSLLIVIPLLNLLIMPAAVIGATHMWMDQKKDKAQQ